MYIDLRCFYCISYFPRFLLLKIYYVLRYIFVKKHNMQIELTSCKLKLLGKLIPQYDIRTWFDGRA